MGVIGIAATIIGLFGSYKAWAYWKKEVNKLQENAIDQLRRKADPVIDARLTQARAQLHGLGSHRPEEGQIVMSADTLQGLIRAVVEHKPHALQQSTVVGDDGDMVPTPATGDPKTPLLHSIR